MNDKKEYIYGRHPVVEALRQGISIDTVFIDQDLTGPIEMEVRSLCKDRNIPLRRLPKSGLNRMLNANHQGILASAAPISTWTTEEMLSHWMELPHDPLLMMCDGITDVRNLGSVARTCVCAGVDGMILSSKNAAPITPDTVKASAGAMHHLTVCRDQSLMTTTALLKNHGIRLLASDVQSKTLLPEMDFHGPICVILGSEDKGVNRMLLAEADATFRIPQSDRFDSFNVSVSAGIILYEVLRQRWERKQ